MAHFKDWTTWIPIAVFIASLLGSGHCVAMCGGLVCASAQTRRDWILYHLGRLGGYLSWGMLAGFLGATVFGMSALPSSHLFSLNQIAAWIAALIMAGTFFSSAFLLWRGRALHFSLLPPALFPWLYRQARNRALWVGGLSSLLPCGWLHSFVLGAVATQSPLQGAIFLFAFWLGTLPALGLTPLILGRFSKWRGGVSPKVAATALFFAGILSLGMKFIPVSKVSTDPATPPHHCH